MVLRDYFPHYESKLAEGFVELDEVHVIKDRNTVNFPAEECFNSVELVVDSPSLTPMNKGAEWIVVVFSFRLDSAGLGSDAKFMDESKTTFEICENIPKKSSRT